METGGVDSELGSAPNLLGTSAVPKFIFIPPSKHGLLIQTIDSQTFSPGFVLPRWPDVPSAGLAHCFLQAHRDTFKYGQFPG